MAASALARMRATMSWIPRLLHEARFRPRWRALLALLAAVAAWFAFRPLGGSPIEFENADKFDHALAFCSMALAGTFSWAAGVRRGASVAAGLLAYGGFIELVQTQVPGRTGSWADLATDAVGITIGLLVAEGLRRRWPMR